MTVEQKERPRDGAAAGTSRRSDPGTEELRRLVALARVTREVLDQLLLFESFGSWSPRLLRVSADQLHDRVEILCSLGPGSAIPDLRSLERAPVSDTDVKLAAALAAAVRTNIRKVGEHTDVLLRALGGEVGSSSELAQVTGVATRLREATMAAWWC